MTTFVKVKVAFEEFLKVPETEAPSDLIKGEIIQKTLPQGEHTRLQGKFCAVINQIVETPKIAYAFSE